jgi:adenylylsulfate kinase-like enzyme
LQNQIKSIWFTGLSAAGKTTLAYLLVDRLRQHEYPVISIDGNEIRDLFENRLGFDPESRRKQTVRVKKLAAWISKNDVLPVISIIHPFEDGRIECRNELKGYYEVYLNCSIKECIRRDNKSLYEPAIKGKKRNVIGIDISYEEPQQSDLTLISDGKTPEELLDELWNIILPRLGSPKQSINFNKQEETI